MKLHFFEHFFYLFIEGVVVRCAKTKCLYLRRKPLRDSLLLLIIVTTRKLYRKTQSLLNLPKEYLNNFSIIKLNYFWEKLLRISGKKNYLEKLNYSWRSHWGENIDLLEM